MPVVHRRTVERPPTITPVRHKVLVMTMALAAITYLDRVTISVTRPYIARDLGLSATQMGYVFSAFYVAYALFEIPTGWWGDKVGTRRVLARIVCWWSAFTVFTGAAADEITEVVFELAEACPSVFEAVTIERTAWSTSPEASVYVCLLAPAIVVQLEPSVEQRCHW